MIRRYFYFKYNQGQHFMQAKQEKSSLPYTLIRDSQANLLQYPVLLDTDVSGKHVVDGDAHGNTLGLMYALIKNGIISLSRENYIKFGKLYYKKLEDYTKEDIQTLHEIYKACEFRVTKETKLIKLGDLICDRGRNDLNTFFFFKMLGNNLNRTIIISNHDAEFLIQFQSNFFRKMDRQSAWYTQFGRSLLGMLTLLDKGLTSESEISELVKEHYYPYLKLVDYSRVIDPTTGEPAIVFYSHAVADLNVVNRLISTELPALIKKELPDYFSLHKSEFTYSDDTMEQLIQTIKYVNQHVNALIRADKFPQLSRLPSFDFILNNRDQNLVTRKQDDLNRLYKVYFFHGHDATECLLSNVEVMDTYFAKSDRQPIAEFISSNVDGQPSPDPKPTSVVDKTGKKPPEQPNLNDKEKQRDINSLDDVFDFDKEEEEDRNKEKVAPKAKSPAVAKKEVASNKEKSEPAAESTPSPTKAKRVAKRTNRSLNSKQPSLVSEEREISSLNDVFDFNEKKDNNKENLAPKAKNQAIAKKEVASNKEKSEPTTGSTPSPRKAKREQKRRNGSPSQMASGLTSPLGSGFFKTPNENTKSEKEAVRPTQTIKHN